MSDFIPPCIKAAVAARDIDALDEIFSYFHTYGTKNMEPVLWSIGYFTFDNYNNKKLTAKTLIRSSSNFLCTILEKPAYLSKYCPGSCPLRTNPKLRLIMMIKSIEISRGDYTASATLTIRLNDGSTFVARNMAFYPTDTTPFFKTVARRFQQWYSKTHHGKEFPDVLPIKDEELADLLRQLVYGGRKYVDEVTSMCEGHTKE